MHETSTIEIDLAAIGRNLRLLRQIVGPDVKICPMVKADAYGLGAARISKTLLAAGADMLAVYTPAQAIELFHKAIGVPVLVLTPVREVGRDDDLYRGFICGRLHLSVHDEDQLSDLIRLAERFGAALPVHLEIDTGMSRGGCSVADGPRLLARIAAHPRLKLAGLFTHFASAEHDVEFTDEQHAQFNRLIEEHANLIPNDCLVHAANSFATMRAPRFHRSMVRIGLAWAGYCLEEMSGGEVVVEGEGLRPAITWASRIIQIKRIAAGTPVGYGSRWRAARDSVIGVVPVGYADGYPVGAGAAHEEWPRHLSKDDGSAQVGITLDSGFVHYAPVIGAVNMDQITIDLTGIADSHEAELRIGTRVELISPDPAAPNHLPRLAERCGTFSHEMICRLNPRLRRIYKTIAAAEIRAAAVA
jgi:alanine racemase